MVNICYILNDNYIDLLLYSLKSLLEVLTDNNEYCIYIVSNHLSLPHQRQLQAMSDGNFCISIVNANDVLPADYDKFGNKKSAILKLYLHRILNVDRVLYLDCDTIVKNSIDALYFADLKNSVIAACPDDVNFTNKEDYLTKYWGNVLKETVEENKEVKDEIIINRGKTYVNSGVMVMDLKELRDSGLGDRMIEYRKTNNTYFKENIPCMDQDTINLMLTDRILVLPLIYNYFVKYDNDYTLELLGITADDITIKHYAFPKPKESVIEWMSLELNGYKLPKPKILAMHIKDYMECFYRKHEYLPNISKPLNFAELWMADYVKQNCFRDIYDLADRVYVREYVKSKGYEHILPELYGVYSSADEIDFDKLPKKFALKCSKGCGLNLVCTNKDWINVEEWKARANEWLTRTKFNPYSWEIHYNVGSPKLIIEEYIEPDEGDCMPASYDIFCRYGKPFAAVSWTLKHGTPYLSRAWYEMPWEFRPYTKYYVEAMPKPAAYDELIEIAKKLSEDLPFARIDLYYTNGKIHFGEVTLSSDAMFFESLTNEGIDNIGEIIRHLS